MQKIPTVFRRDPDDMRHVLPEVTPGCEWVLAGEGVATRNRSDHHRVGTLGDVDEVRTAYLAGIVDGEGSFIIYLKGGGRRPERKYHRCMLSIANTDRPLIELLHEHLGGRVGKTEGVAIHHRTVYRVIVEGRSLRGVTELLLPYLRVKRRQAELMLKMLDTMTTSRGKALPPDVLAERDQIYAEYVEAKHGPSRCWGGRRLA